MLQADTKGIQKHLMDFARSSRPKNESKRKQKDRQIPQTGNYLRCMPKGNSLSMGTIGIRKKRQPFSA